MRLKIFSAALGFELFIAQLAYGQGVQISPQNPKALETVRISAPWRGLPALEQAETLTMTANKIVFTARYRDIIIPGPLPTPRHDVVIGQLPAGSYEVEFRSGFTTSPNSSSLVATATFTVSDASTNRTAPFPHYDYTDLWWNANESGWGINITVKNDKLFGAWFVYGADGKPIWYTIQPSSWSNSTTYSGIVVKATGPAFGGIGPLTGGVTPALAGNATITFTSYDTATITGTVDGQAVNKTITRQVF